MVRDGRVPTPTGPWEDDGIARMAAQFEWVRLRDPNVGGSVTTGHSSSAKVAAWWRWTPTTC